jgi:ubiquinone/menaquinone biosynthesis C-methylase UbiE
VKINTNRWNRLRYTLIAPIYDHVVGLGRQRRHSIGLLELRPGERVLISGVGTGADLPFIPEGVEVHAIDITPAMVERTRRRAAALGRAVEVRVGDAQALDYADASFDAVILHLIVAVAPDGRRVLEEAARVLKPGGRAVVFDKFAPEGRRPSLGRRVLNLVANVVATDVTRQLEPLVAGTGLEIVRREPAAFGRVLEIALFRRTTSPTS